MTENVTRTEAGGPVCRPYEDGEGLRVIRSMAGMIVDMKDQLQALQLKVAMLEKVTPMQAKDLNGRIRERACDLEMGYGLPEGSAQKLMTAIRRAVRMETGARSTRDVARCDYPVVCGLIGDWEDYETITKMRMEKDHDGEY